jgi:hypothetical protein
VAVLVALALVVALGLLTLGANAAIAVRQRQALQAATDSAALAAMLALRADPAASPVAVARAALAEQGVSGGTGHRVIVRAPPTEGPHAGDRHAIELLVSRPVARPFPAPGAGGSVEARSVATLGVRRGACLLALDPGNRRAIAVDRPGDLALDGCTMLSAAALHPIPLAEADPFRDLDLGSAGACIPRPTRIADRRILAGGPAPALLCGDVDIATGGELLLGPGRYRLAGGDPERAAGGRLAGRGVTLILMPGAALDFAAGAAIALTAPAGGPTAGLAIAAAGRTPALRLAAGAGQGIEGAVWVPERPVEIAQGRASDCALLIARTVRVSGPTRLAADCARRAIEDRVARLAE